MSYSTLSTGAIADLSAIVGQANLLTAPVELACYAPVRPDAVVLPGSTAEVTAVLALANGLRLPVFARGGGTALATGPQPPAGGLVVATSRLNRILELDTANLTASVEPGAVVADLQTSVERLGLFYPPDPTSLTVATVGGTMATNASGPRGLKYGSTKDFVLGLEVVLADGTLLHTGARTMKSSSGYDLTHLFVGSRGTLGLVTRVITRLLPLPEARTLVVATFASVAGAARAALATIAAGLQPSAVEILDGAVLAALHAFQPSPLPGRSDAVLVCEVDGSRRAVAHQAPAIAAQLVALGAESVTRLEDPDECLALWAARRAAYPALARGHEGMVFAKAVVPRNRVPALVVNVDEVTRRHGLPAAVLAHAGDGIVHPVMLANAGLPDKATRIAACLADLSADVVALGGRLIGGRSGTDAVASQIMCDLRTAFDPQGILNPGKTSYADERLAGTGANGDD